MGEQGKGVLGVSVEFMGYFPLLVLYVGWLCAERLLTFFWKSAGTVCLLSCPRGLTYVGKNNQGIKGKSFWAQTAIRYWG